MTALKRSELRTVTPTEHRQTRASREVIDCPACGKPVCGAAVVTTPPFHAKSLTSPLQELSPDYRGHLVYRRAFFDCCNHIISWYQEARSDGTLGVEIGAYKVTRDQDLINKFLREHPEAKGVEQ